jgi:phospholipid/cholesterol/gamma-HCH transport system substrate-binding protein
VASEEATHRLRSLNEAIGDGSKVGRTLDDVAVSTALVKKELPVAIEKLQHALDQARKLGESIDRIPPDEVERLVRHAASAAENADRTLAEARVITERVRSGGGTVGLLLADDEIYDDLKELLRDLKQHPWKLVWKQ